LQKSFQQLADEKQLHLVELRAEHSDYPEVVASPSKVRKADEVPSDEILDFNRYLMDGKIRLRKKKSVPFYTRFPSYQLHLKKMERMRHYDDTKIRILAEHGKLQSFLTEKYPEASCINLNKKEMNSDE
jgi:small subunit ribosomal protein S5